MLTVLSTSRLIDRRLETDLLNLWRVRVPIFRLNAIRQIGLIAWWWTRQNGGRLMPDDNLTRGGGKYWHETDLFLLSAQLIPRQPDAIRCAQVAGAEVLGELFRSVGKPLIRL